MSRPDDDGEGRASGIRNICICTESERRYGPFHACPAHSAASRPAAPATVPDLREQVFGTVAVWHSTLPVEHLQSLADAVLALPALQRLAEQAAEAARLRGRVEAITLAISQLTDTGHPTVRGYQTPAMRRVLTELRRALDGTDG